MDELKTLVENYIAAEWARTKAKQRVLEKMKELGIKKYLMAPGEWITFYATQIIENFRHTK